MHPPARVRVNFRTVFAGWLRFGGICRRSLRATTKKRSSTFWQKSAPQTKSWLATPMAGTTHNCAPAYLQELYSAPVRNVRRRTRLLSASTGCESVTQAVTQTIQLQPSIIQRSSAFYGRFTAWNSQSSVLYHARQ